MAATTVKPSGTRRHLQVILWEAPQCTFPRRMDAASFSANKPFAIASMSTYFYIGKKVSYITKVPAFMSFDDKDYVFNSLLS